MMRKRVFGAVVGGLGLAVGLGACVGQDPVVGENKADEVGESGAPSLPESGGTGGGGVRGGIGGTGASAGQLGAQVVDESIAYMISQLRTAPATADPLCMPKPLPVDATGLASCRVFRSEMDENGALIVPSACACDAPDRGPMDPAVRKTALDYMRAIAVCDFGNAPACDDVCLCELLQTKDDRRAACLAEAPLDSRGEGWCYISPEQGVGTTAILDECPRQGRTIRFFGDAIESSYYLLTCGGTTTEAATWPTQAAALGEPCLPRREAHTNFEGFSMTDVTLDLGGPACESGLCLVNHMEGRVSCPYGQFSDALDLGNPSCFVPGSDAAVTVPVQPQRLARRADDVVTCSCQCDGPGPGPYCDCPDDMVCSPVVDAVGIPSADAHVGSYCVKRGTEYDLSQVGLVSPETCADGAPGRCGDPRPY
ncbi:MAG TPA: hypothetical protein VNN72_24375 [Polyangiaceae bacterium]|nr:hypothetical protein [Polyangiaceae bacterium]